MKNYLLLFVFALLFLAIPVCGQKYITAAGLRIDKAAVGLSVQQRILPKSTLEGIGLIGAREFSGAVLFEQHFPIITNGFNYYVGAGAHLGHLKDHGNFYGGDLIIGIEMKVPVLPLNLSFDLKPAFHVNHEDWFAFQGGFTLRTILIKQKKKPVRIFQKEFWQRDSNPKKGEQGGFFRKNETPDKEEKSWFQNLMRGEEE